MVRAGVPVTVLAKEDKKVWTLVIRGGEPFDLVTPRHPRLEHAGKQTLWKFHGTCSEVEELRSCIQTEFQAAVDVFTEGFVE